MKPYFFRISLAVLAVSVLFPLHTFAVSRSFPETRTKAVSVFADQLPVQDMNDDQVRFAATHYIGTQKLYKNQIEKLRVYNPNFFLLHYRLAHAAGTAPGIAHDSESDGSLDGNNFSAQEWTDGIMNKDWFIKNSRGQRIKNSRWNWYPFDLARSESLRNEVADYWINRVKKEVTATQSDGVFADSFGVPFGPWDRDHIPNYIYDSSWHLDVESAKSWLTSSLVPYSDRVWTSLKASGIPYIPNCGQLITGWDSIDNYTHSDGCMIEGFTGFDESITEPNDWKLEMNNMLTLAKKGKVTIAQSNFTGWDNLQRRGFIVGSYLMSKGEKSYVNMFFSQNNGVEFQWFPEYDVPLGTYLNLPNNVDELGWNGVFRRNFTKGFVLVNPYNETKEVLLGGSYSLAVFARGGAVQKEGVNPGSISYSTVSRVTLSPQSAAFFLDNVEEVPVVESGCPLSLDQAYQVRGNKAVYYVDLDCKKRPFHNARIYFTYFDSWNEVKFTSANLLSRVPNHELGFMPLGPKYDPKYGAVVKTVNDARVYFLLNNKKYWITSEDVFNKLNYKWDWIEDVDERLLKQYGSGGEIDATDHHRDGTIVKYLGSPKVYLLEDGKKRHIVDEATFNTLGYRWDRIVTLPASETYPDGEEKTQYAPIRFGTGDSNDNVSGLSPNSFYLRAR